MRKLGTSKQEAVGRSVAVLFIVCGQRLYKLCVARVQIPLFIHKRFLKAGGWGKVSSVVHKLYSVFTTSIPHINRTINSLGKPVVPLFHTTNNNDYELNKGITK